jgi:hypothetical protein
MHYSITTFKDKNSKKYMERKKSIEKLKERFFHIK